MTTYNRNFNNIRSNHTSAHFPRWCQGLYISCIYDVDKFHIKMVLIRFFNIFFFLADKMCTPLSFPLFSSFYLWISFFLQVTNRRNNYREHNKYNQTTTSRVKPRYSVRMNYQNTFMLCIHYENVLFCLYIYA